MGEDVNDVQESFRHRPYFSEIALPVYLKAQNARIRLDVAEAALRSGHTVGQAAELAGFASDLQLRRT